MTTIQIRNDAQVELLEADFYSRDNHIVLSDDRWVELDERAAAPALPAADRIRVFSRDDGAGNSQLCFIDAAGNVVCSGGGVAAPHNLLSATHPDTVVSAVNRGDLVVGTAAGWDDLVIGPAATFLRSDGADPSWQAIGAADLPAHTHSGAGQGGSLVVGTTDTDATQGSVFFAGVGGVIREDNARFFWDDTNDYLGVNMNTPAAHIEVNAATATDVGLIVQTTDDSAANNLVEIHDSGVNTLTTFNDDGHLLFTPQTNSTTVLEVRNVAGTTILTVDTANNRVGIGTNAPEHDLDVLSFAGRMQFRANSGMAAGGIFLRRQDATIFNNNNLGLIWFTGDDATAPNTPGAAIYGVADGAWAAGSTPGKLEIHTTPSGTEALVTRVVVDNAGQMGINVGAGATPSAQLEVVSGAAARIVQIIQGAAAQAAHLVIYEDSAGNNFYESSTGLAGSTTTWNQQGVDIDFYVEAVGVADALFIRGSDGQITLGVLGAGYVQSDAGGVLSVTPTATPTAHNLLSAQHGDTVISVVTRGDMVVGTAAGWDDLAHPGGAGYALTTDANDVVWDQTPLWTGVHTHAADVVIDDGGADSPELQFVGNVPGTTVVMFLEGDIAPNIGDLVVRLADAAGNSRFSIQDSTPVDVLEFDSDGNIHMVDDAWAGIASNDLRVEFDSSDGDVMVGLGDAAGSDEFQVLDNANAVVFTVNSNGATAIRTTAIANAVGLYVPWLAGDADTTAYFGSTNASNDQYAIEAHSYSSAAIRATSESSDAISTFSTSGRGGQFSSTSGWGLGCLSETGIALVAALAGAGTSIAQFRDNGNIVFEIDDGGNAISTVPTGTAMTINLTGAGTAILDCQDNGTTAFIVDDGGNVGVGNIAAPSFPLEVDMGSAITPAINIIGSTSVGNTSRATMGFDLDAGLTQGFVLGAGFGDDTQDFYLYDLYDTALRLVVSTDGHVYPGGAKSQDLGLATNEWDDFYYVTLHAGTSRLIDSPMTCPVCQAGMKKGTGGMNIRGEVADYELVFCIECGAVAVETHTKQTPEMLAARRPPPKILFKGLRTKSQGGHDYKMMVDFEYIADELDDEGNIVKQGVFNSTRLGDGELAAFLAMTTDEERRAFLLALGEREWYAREEVRTMQEHVDGLRAMHEALVKNLVGTDLLQ
jgi:hypothetical protein